MVHGLTARSFRSLFCRISVHRQQRRESSDAQTFCNSRASRRSKLLARGTGVGLTSPTMLQPTYASCARIWCVRPVSSLTRTSYKSGGAPSEPLLLPPPSAFLPSPCPPEASRPGERPPAAAPPLRGEAHPCARARSTTSRARGESRTTGIGVAESTTRRHSCSPSAPPGLRTCARAAAGGRRTAEQLLCAQRAAGP